MDIVDWLRNCGNIGLAIEAAQEIEKLREERSRLREALRVIRDELGDTPRDSMRAYEISDAALKEVQ